MRLAPCVAAAVLASLLGPAPGADAAPLDGFARCLRDRGATFYGTYWCPQCAKQHDMFGPSGRYLRYVECADGSRDETPACMRAGIAGYPTWQFADGSRVTGRLSLEQLSRRSGCRLPD